MAQAQQACPGNRHYFVGRPNVNAARGQITQTLIRNPALDPCVGSNRHTTAHVSELVAPFRFMEVGWWSMRDAQGVQRCYSFYEARIGTNNYVGPYFFLTTCGNSSKAKVSHVSGTTWRTFFDENDDGVYEDQYPDVNVGIGGGRPFGETAINGAVSAYDHHDDLSYRSSGGSWLTWTCQERGLDEIGTYHWDLAAGNEYEIHMPDAEHEPSPLCT